MPKAKQQAAAQKEPTETTRKAARPKSAPTVKRTAARKTTATTTKVATSRQKAKPAVKKPAPKRVAKKVVAKKVVTGKATKVAAKPRPATKSTSTARPTGRKVTKAKSVAAVAAGKMAPTRNRRRSLVVDVTPVVIDTSLAAEVAAALVRQGQAKAETLAQSTTPLPAPEVVKRGSSALRHVKETLANPISRQLDSVFGPLMTPQVSAFLSSKALRAARSQPAGKKFDPHTGHFGVPRRAAG